MRSALWIMAVAMGGCGGSTAVVPTGLDTYMVASHGTAGSSSAAQRAKASEEAREYCERSGKQADIIRAMDSGPGSYGENSSAEVHFRCVTAAAPK